MILVINVQLISDLLLVNRLLRHVALERSFFVIRMKQRERNIVMRLRCYKFIAEESNNVLTIRFRIRSTCIEEIFKCTTFRY
jgi:hypothetical protein